MARLGRALQDRFPKYFTYFKTPSFTYQGRKIANHNRLLGRVAGVNGIKTGYTRASGYNLVTSVDRDGKKLVAVVMGGKSGSSRDQRMASLVTDYIPKATSGPRTASLILPNGTSIDSDIAFADAAPSAVDSAAVASLVAEDERSQGDIGEDDATSAVPSPKHSTIPAAAASGWKIQLAATPTEAAAQALLDSAKDKAPKLLAKASPFTERVVKNSVTLYRARFAGFATKQAARDACDALTKQKFTCLALSN
jgi:D-alanyl-D-alanine carboxypeptidase